VEKKRSKLTNQREVVQDMAAKEVENVVYLKVEQEVVATVSCCRLLIFPVIEEVPCRLIIFLSIQSCG
jgi:hypothetical protein